MFLSEGIDYGCKQGVCGLYNEKGVLIKPDKEIPAQARSDFKNDYNRRRGPKQIEVDRQVVELERKSQEQKRQKPYDPRQERIDLQVVSGGKAGFVSKMPKPTAGGIPGESKADFNRRLEKWNKSQELAKSLTQKQRASLTQQPASTPPQPPSTPSSGPSSTAGRPTPPPAPSRPSGEAPRPQPARPTPSAPSRSSSASASTAEKIRSGLDVYKTQQKAGDYKAATQTGLDVWRLNPANAKLVAAADERARTRGTSATTNPQMADLKANLPAPKTQSDSENNFFDRSRRTAAAMGLSGTLKNIAPLSIRTPVPDMKESYEPYDIILEYLIDGGHATTLDEANYIMFELDEQAISTIIGNFEDELIAEEISYWVDSLINEGYDLSDYSWDDIVEYYLSEAKYGTKKGRKKLAKKVRAGKDVGNKGGGFEKIVKKATPKYGKERATKIAAAAMWKNLG